MATASRTDLEQPLMKSTSRAAPSSKRLPSCAGHGWTTRQKAGSRTCSKVRFKHDILSANHASVLGVGGSRVMPQEAACDHAQDPSHQVYSCWAISAAPGRVAHLQLLEICPYVLACQGVPGRDGRDHRFFAQQKANIGFVCAPVERKRFTSHHAVVDASKCPRLSDGPPVEVPLGFRHHIVFTDFTVLGPRLVCEVTLPSAFALERSSKKLSDGKDIFIWGLYRVWGRLWRHQIIVHAPNVGHEADREVISSWGVKFEPDPTRG